MQDKEKVEKLIQSLFISQEEKQKLLDKLGAEGVSRKLMEEIRGVVDNSIVDFEDEAEEKIKEIRESLAQTTKNLTELFAQIEKDAKEQEKTVARKKDEENLAKIRESISKI